MTTIVPYDGGPEWDTFMFDRPDASFAHLAGWRDVMTDTLGHECRYMVARDADGRPEGALPLVRVRSALFGHYLVSMPFLNAGGPVGEPAARRALALWAAAHAEQTRADLLELRTTTGLGVPLRTSHRRITVHLDLPSESGDLWRLFPSKLRSQIRRPMKDNCVVRFGVQEREAFYEVFARTMRSLGTPVLPAVLFARLAEVFPEYVDFGVVYCGDTPVAGGCGFTFAGEFELQWAGSLREFRRSSPNMLLYWRFMEHAIVRGVRRFNFGRCAPGGPVHAFKRQWGGRDVELPWTQWSSHNVTAPPSPDRPVYRLAASYWRRLPMFLANRLGPPIAARIP